MMTDLNESQEIIAKTLDGMVVVDAGPGTGKTHTIVQRYRNILNIQGMDPRDILLMTFTNNAAAEMRERLESTVGNDTVIQATTFDAFCLDLVLESSESVSSALGFKESLTRSANLVQSTSMNREYFRKVYQRFIKEHGSRYHGMSAVASASVNDLFDLIEKLMSRGIIPLPDYDWFGEGTALLGDKRELLGMLRTKNGPNMVKRIREDLEDDAPEWLSDDMTEIPDEMLQDIADEDRKYLIWMVHDIYREYLRSSIADNRLTFAIVELFALAALYGDENVRNRSSYRYVMIDEFQDTNELQLKIALLIMKEPNLCAVGDWKQGIYGFRNVSIDNIIKFKDRVESARRDLNRNAVRVKFKVNEVNKFPLRENYRSSQTIIDAAYRALLIPATASEKMVDRSDDIVPIRAVRDDIRENTGFEMICAEDLEKEIYAVAQTAQEYVASGRYTICENGSERSPRYSDIAVLCKKNEMGRMIRDKMEELGIPVFLQGDAKIMSTREAKLALAWLRYVNNGNDTRGPVTIMADMGYTMAEIESVTRRINPIPEDIRSARSELVKRKRRMTSLLTSIFSIYGMNNDVTQAIISAISAAHRESMLTISDVIRLIENDMERSETYEMDPSLDREAVTVQTMHKSKGLEYPIVIIAGVNQRSFPRSERSGKGFVVDDLYGMRTTSEYFVRNGYHRMVRSWRWSAISHAMDFDYDEQRRLLFVAISRAKQYVTMISHNPSNFMKGYGESNIINMEPTLQKVTFADDVRSAERPVIPGSVGKRIEMSVHDIMGEFVGSEGGKGIEYGNRVHEAAQLMAIGRSPPEDIPETEEIQRILDSVSSADILTEVDCTLPVGNVILRGIIDMIAIFPDRVEVHDYKTDMNMKNHSRYEVQVSVYHHAVSAYFQRPVECMIDYVSQKESKKANILSLEEISRLIKIYAPDL